MVNRTKPYRLKHIKSGLYYQPLSQGGNNLGVNGKVYLTKKNGLDDAIDGDVYIAVKMNSRVYRLTKYCIDWKEHTYMCDGVYARVPVSDFEIEYLEVE